MKLNPVYIICFVVLMLSACVKDKPNPDNKSIPLAGSGLLILNEGSYGNNNADLSWLDLHTLQVSNNVYKSINNKPLGDVAQSITLIEGRYFVAVNNSHKIAVLDTSDLSLINTISPIPFPRYIVQVKPDIAYVSSLYMPHVYILQLSSGTVLDTLFTDYPNTEKMLLVNDEIWICNWDTACNYLYKVDIHTNELKEKVSLGNGYAAHDVLQDRFGMLWILSGNKYKNKPSFLTCIDPANNAIVKNFAFNEDADPVKMSMNKTRDTIYYINVNYNGNATNNGLFCMATNALTLPENPLIKAPAHTYFWAIGIDPFNAHIFLSDPKGFTQSSTVYEYTPQGDLLRSFQTGVGSGQFLFR